MEEEGEDRERRRIKERWSGEKAGEEGGGGRRRGGGRSEERRVGKECKA